MWQQTKTRRNWLDYRWLAFGVVASMLVVACEFDPATYSGSALATCDGQAATHGFGYLPDSPFLPDGASADPAGGGSYFATAGDDVIVIANGPVEVNALGGNDLICVQGLIDTDGPIVVEGGSGTDRLIDTSSALVFTSSVELGGPGSDAECSNLSDAQMGMGAGRGIYEAHLAVILDRPGSTGTTFAPTHTRNGRNDNSDFECTPHLDLPTNSNGLNYATDSHLIFNSAQEPTVSNSREGNFRSRCDFSHLAYDDPIVHPDNPGAAHLHMFFGNTHANAYSTYESLLNSGSSTCMGRELNRTAYWVPAMFDGNGDVRIPEFMRVYYKNSVAGLPTNPGVPPITETTDAYPLTNQAGQIDGMELVLPQEPNAAVTTVWFCGNSVFTGSNNNFSSTIPACDNGTPTPRNDGVHDLVAVLNFPYCWDGVGFTIDSLSFPANNSEVQPCPSGTTRLPQLQYIVVWKDVNGTSGWRLSSDPVNTTTPGATLHGDWFGAWHPAINQRWVDNCNNLGELSGGEGAAGTYGVNCNDYLLGDGTRLTNRDSESTTFDSIGDKVVAFESLAALCVGTIIHAGGFCQ